MVPLERALSKLGLASRTQARELILAGRVRVAGVVRKDPGYAVRPETARIEIDGVAAQATTPRYVMLHKPRGVISTREDEKGRPTALGLVDPDLGNLHSVGRLDGATTGLLLLTNDTRFSAWIADPASGIAKTYVVTVRGEVTPEDLKRFETGVRDEGELLRAPRAQVRKASGKESHLTLTLTEGKNREIRRLCSALGHEVTRLKRVSMGGLLLGDLEPGEWRELEPDEILSAFPGAPFKARS